MSTESSIAVVVAAVALIGTLVTAFMARRSAQESTQSDGWAKLTAAQRIELDSLRSRVDAVERKVNAERRERIALTEVLRSAWSYILRLGGQIRDLGGHPADPPPELVTWMRQDGLVVDRVETTISRTTVTDTRTPEEDALDVERVEIHPLDDDPDATD